MWFQDGELNGASPSSLSRTAAGPCLERSATGEELAEVDHGYLEQDTGDAEQYAAHSNQFDDVTYDMHTTYERDDPSGGAGKPHPTCARRTASEARYSMRIGKRVLRP